MKELREEIEGMGELRETVVLVVREVLNATGAGMIISTSGNRKDPVLESRHLMSCCLNEVLGERFTPYMGADLFNCTRPSYYALRYSAKNRMDTDKRFKNRVEVVLKKINDRVSGTYKGMITCEIRYAIGILEKGDWEWVKIGVEKKKYTYWRVNRNKVHSLWLNHRNGKPIGEAKILRENQVVTVRMKEE